MYYTSTASDYVYSISGSTITLTDYIGTQKNIIVPNTLDVDGNTYNVAVSGTFQEDSTVQNVIIDNVIALNNIASRLFNACSELKSIKGNFSNAANIIMSFWFAANCPKLELVDVDTSSWISNNFRSICENSILLNEFTGALPITFSKFEQNFYNCNNLKEITILNEEFASETVRSLTKSNITIKVPANSNSYRWLKSYCSKWSSIYNIETIDNEIDNSNIIACYGDSITSVLDASSYSMKLYNMIDNTIALNYGVGSENTLQIAYRTGTYKVYVNSFIIPASSTETVPITLIGEKGGKVPYEFSDVTIAGVRGRIIRTSNADPQTYEFQRWCDGNAVQVKDNTIIKMGSDISNLPDNSYIVINAGTNDNAVANTINRESTINIINDIIEYANTDKYIVCGITTNRAYQGETVEEYEQSMSDAFGSHFLNMRTYFISNGYNIIEAEPDETAIADMNVGLVPTIFLADDCHPNDNGTTVMATAIKEMIENVL